MIDEILNVIAKGKDKVFYKIGNEVITYNQLYEKVIKLSNNLKKQGEGPVIIYGSKEIDTIVSIISCVVAKRCYIPIDYGLPQNRIEKIINASGASLVLNSIPLKVNDIESYTVYDFNLKYDDIDNYYEISNKIAYIIFTSGSTGDAKGVPISYDNLDNFINWIINDKVFDNIDDLVLLSQASFSFDLSVMDIYFSIYKNLTIVAIDGKDKQNIVDVTDIIRDNNINFLVMTPTFCKMLLINNEFDEGHYPDIRYMFFCGECLEIETVKKIRNKFKNVKMINAYGPTEATCCVSLVEVKDNMLGNKYLPVGLIDEAAVKIDIVDEEIVLKGKSVFEGYLNTKSDKCYLEEDNNCFATGDYGYIDNNYLYCQGRKDDQIKYKGYRVELGDIENNLLKIDGISEAVVVASYMQNSNIVKMIKAYVTINKNIDEDYIKREMNKLMPSYMIPKAIKIVEAIPTNFNDKYDRRSLEEL